MKKPLGHGKVEFDQKRGADRGGSSGRAADRGAATIASGSRNRPCHLIKKAAALDISTNEGIQTELAAEVVIDRTSGHVRRRQLPDRHVVECARAELPNGTAASAKVSWGRLRSESDRA